MLPTHAVVGIAIATPLAVFYPDLAPAALAGALVGSVAPDLDMYAGHRRTLHYPTGYLLVALPITVVAMLVPVPPAVGVACVVVGAAVHCQLDRFGAGLELRPWEATSDRAVYDHVRGRWLRPKRWIRYDGAPEDLALSLVVGLPLSTFLDGPFRAVVALALVVGGIYALLRRWLAAVAPTVFEYVPSRLQQYVPERYRT